jgi:hypothetical protein
LFLPLIVNPLPHSIALFAVALAVLHYSEIVTRKWMAPPAMCLTGVNSCDRISPEGVLSGRCRSEVVRVYAESVVANMVQLLPWWNRPNEGFVGKTVSKVLSLLTTVTVTFDAEHAVPTTAYTSLPHPAVQFDYLCHEPLQGVFSRSLLHGKSSKFTIAICTWIVKNNKNYFTDGGKALESWV